MLLRTVFTISLMIAVAFSAGCVHTTTTRPTEAVPQGFARYEEPGELRAVSPDGVTFRVRTQDNKPYADLSFWKEALKKRMLDAGYLFLSASGITAGQQKGYLLELAAPYGNQDYTYLTAIFVDEKKIHIVESAGEVLAVARRRADIVAAIEKMTGF